MQENSSQSLKWFVRCLFGVLTFWCWCPLGYGSYGEVERIMGMPSWASVMLLVGAVLFIVEWVYLFKTDFALYDHELDDIIEALSSLDESGNAQETVKEA
ncbi:MAG: DUF997 domain-containing protein [Desulfobacterales bacterium]|nr:DUF997 domain-containing protein [Desulfobacterales bacterium]